MENEIDEHVTRKPYNISDVITNNKILVDILTQSGKSDLTRYRYLSNWAIAGIISIILLFMLGVTLLLLRIIESATSLTSELISAIKFVTTGFLIIIFVYILAVGLTKFLESRTYTREETERYKVRVQAITSIYQYETQLREQFSVCLKDLGVELLKQDRSRSPDDIRNDMTSIGGALADFIPLIEQDVQLKTESFKYLEKDIDQIKN